jgi:hypothetical protein
MDDFIGLRGMACAGRKIIREAGSPSRIRTYNIAFSGCPSHRIDATAVVA